MLRRREKAFMLLFVRPELLFVAPTLQLRHCCSSAHREQTGLCVGHQLLPRIRDVEVPHRELADPISWRECRFAFFHGQTFRLEGEIWGRCIQDGIVVSPSQFECDLA